MKILFAGATLSIPAGIPVGTATVVPRSAMHDQVRSLVVYWAGRYGVSRSLALALAWMESGFPDLGRVQLGAFGPMQVTPATREFVDVVLLGMPVPHTTSGEVQAGVVYLGHLLRRFGGDERLALAGYFHGPRGCAQALVALHAPVRGERARAEVALLAETGVRPPGRAHPVVRLADRLREALRAALSAANETSTCPPAASAARSAAESGSSHSSAAPSRGSRPRRRALRSGPREHVARRAPSPRA